MVKGLELKDFNFSDYDVVRNIILNRSELELRTAQSNTFLQYRLEEVDYVIKDLIQSLYQKLDLIILCCEFKQENLMLLNYLFLGMSFQEIGERMNMATQSVFNRLRRIIIKINNTSSIVE